MIINRFNLFAVLIYCKSYFKLSKMSLKQISVTVYTCLLAPLFSAKPLACHVPHGSRMITKGGIFYGDFFFSESNEISPIFVTDFLSND